VFSHFYKFIFSRKDFLACFDLMDQVSTAPNWTIVFCSVHASQHKYIHDIVQELGLKMDMWIWAKPDCYGKSHGGGARQACASETIFSCYKHDTSSGAKNDLSNHYALLKRQKNFEVPVRRICSIYLG